VHIFTPAAPPLTLLYPVLRIFTPAAPPPAVLHPILHIFIPAAPFLALHPVLQKFTTAAPAVSPEILTFYLKKLINNRFLTPWNPKDKMKEK
jgi:hypothetical protein